MKKIILDVETTRQKNPITGKDDPSPYNPLNRLVTVQIKDIDSGDKYFYVFGHKEKTIENLNDSLELQILLNQTKEIIGHNLKFDISWLLEAGFAIPEDCIVYDTMIWEYVNLKGLKKSLKLKDLAIEYNLTQKLDILEDYWQKGVNTDEIPLNELMEYALGDIETTYELYCLQAKRSVGDSDAAFMEPAIRLTNEALPIIIEMERNGCYIDKETLAKVEQEYINELTILTRKMQERINYYMGDTPINLDSPDDMSMLLYGFEVKDKKAWQEKFGIGTSERNSVKKRKWPTRMSPVALKNTINAYTDKVYKTEAEQCSDCKGKGKIRKVKLSGEPYKNETICSLCGGIGFVYNVWESKENLAGLKLEPISSQFATAAGFAADKKVIEQYLSRESLDNDTKTFLRDLQRQSAIKTYLNTFVEGIKNNVKQDNILHTNLNQCITATGRLSASNPNLQNLPRGSTFPVRKVIKSRFVGGSILEADFAGLEYRVACMLSKCPVGLSSIINGKDRHQISAEIIFGKSKEDYDNKEWKQVRQEAKRHSFKPLYGGMSGTESEKRYYQHFMSEHTGIAKWHTELCNEAVEFKQIKTPMCRIFAFPNVKRKQDGSVIGKTQIVNYPVQSAATADIIWCVLVDIFNEMRLRNMKSKLILQVHDSLIIDIYPEEEKIVIDIVKKVLYNVKEYLKERFNFETEVPFDFEIKIGKSWGELEKVK